MSLLKDFVSIFKPQSKNVQSTAVLRYTMNYEEARNVGVLFSHSNDDNPKAINYFVKLLQRDRKNVKALAYFEEKHTNPYDFRFDFFTASDIDSKGRIRSLQVDEFIQREFDYLYCVNVVEFAPFYYIMKNSRAKFRIGKFYPQMIDAFELMIDIGDNTNAVDLILQMLHFTKTFIIHNPKLTKTK